MPETLVPHPTNGTFVFGAIERRAFKPCVIPAGPVVLKRGRHSPRGGFGVRHIWMRHRLELARRGYGHQDDVAAYVAAIVRPGAPLFCEFAFVRTVRVTVVRSAFGVAILEHQEANDHYSIVTAFSQTNAHGVRIGSII